MRYDYDIVSGICCFNMRYAIIEYRTIFMCVGKFEAGSLLLISRRGQREKGRPLTLSPLWRTKDKANDNPYHLNLTRLTRSFFFLSKINQDIFFW